MTKAVHSEDGRIKRRLTTELMFKWGGLAEEYRQLPVRYQDLLDIRRELKIQPLRKIADSVLKEYPKIEFFEAVDEHEARHMLKTMTISQLRILLLRIEELAYNYSVCTLRSRVVDFAYQVEHFNRCKSRSCGKVRQAKSPSKTYKRLYSDS